MTASVQTVAVSDDGGTLTLTLCGEIDLSNVEALGEDLRRRITIRGPAAVVVDLSDVQYIDSRGVLLLVRLVTRLRDEGIPLRLVAPAESIAGRVLAITGFRDDVSAH